MRKLLALGSWLAATASLAAADPASSPPPAAPGAAASSSLLPPSVLLLPPTPPDLPSLRVEAARAAFEQFEDSWRFPDVAPILGLEGGLWFVGHGRYHPRSARAAALHSGSIAATIVGELLLQADLPVAGIGAMLTGATLDAATADADRAAGARR